MIYTRAIALRIFTDKLRVAKTPHAEQEGVLVYSFGEESYACVFSFGVVVFWNVPPVKQEQFTAEVLMYAKVPLEQPATQQYELSIGKRDDLNVDKISVQSLNVLDVVSLSFLLAQSVVLARMDAEADDQLYNLNRILRPIEKTGKIRLRRKALIKQLGAVLRTRTHAFYEFGFDQPPASAWNDARREVMHKQLNEVLAIRARMHQVDTKWRTVTEEMEFVLSLITEREDLHIEMLLVLLGLAIHIGLTVWQILEESGTLEHWLGL